MAVLTPARTGDDLGCGWHEPGPRFGTVECVLDPGDYGRRL
jgi:hypothetical protein